jgi:hypothetical protein
MPRNRHLAGALLLGLLFALSACGARGNAPPEAGYERGGVPSLQGQRVLVLPPQNALAGHGALEEELSFQLTDRGQGIDWVLPGALRDRMERSPELDFSIERLPVQGFLAGRLERIGDPLYGQLYRLGAVENADLALLPVEVRQREAATGGTERHVEIVASLVEVRSGRVLWFGVVEGAAGAPGELATTASAVDALARRLVP